MDTSQYSEKVMEHFKNPRNVGEISNPSGIGHVGNPICGDIMELYIKVENNVIVDAKFKTFGCLPKDEEIVTSKGGWDKISIIDKGHEVLNSEGENTLVSQTHKRYLTGYLLKIIPFVSPFNSFSVTSEHPVLCVKRKWVKGNRKSSRICDWLRINESRLFSTKPDFIKAKDLEKGDYLIFMFNKKVVDNNFYTNEFMKLLGYYLSEGYITAKGNVVCFSFNKNEVETINEVKSLIYKLTNKKTGQRTRGNVTEIWICSKKLADLLQKVAKKGATTKSLSSDILLLPFSKQWEMLKTYMIGDGDKYRRRGCDSETYRIITTSKNLAIQAQEILARGGIFASIRNIFKTQCKIGNRILKDSVQYLISFKLDRKHRFVHKKDKYFLVPIRKIKKIDFDGFVYNFGVATEPNSYLARGFAVHNCGAAIATSSMVTELVKGKTVDEALKISNRAVAEALGGLPPIKMHCSLLAEEALKSAIEDYLKKKKVDA